MCIGRIPRHLDGARERLPQLKCVLVAGLLNVTVGGRHKEAVTVEVFETFIHCF